MKKTISILLTFVLLSSGVLSLCAAAETPTEITVDMGYTQAVQFDPRTAAPSIDNSGTAHRFFASTADTPYTFYMYLTERQKDVYNTLLNAGLDSADNVNGVKITFTTPITCQNTTTSLTAEAKNELALAVQGGVAALMDDHPEMFWLGAYKLSYSYSYSVSGGVYTLSVSSITCKMNYDTAVYADKASVTDYYTRMMAAFDAFEVKGYTRYEKVKSIHDTIAKQVSYDSTFTNGTAHQPTSVFLEPFLPVCEGYAEAFKMLCDREGIPCVIVVGKSGDGGHAWNYIKMEDGKWYAVDLTWDDQGSIYYDYFLVGANSTNRHFGNNTTTFSDKHTATGNHFQGGLYVLPYPELSQTAYAQTLGRANVDIAVRKADGIVLLGKSQSLSTAFIAPYGSTISVSGTTTGGTVTVTQGGTTTTYTVARRGDVVVDNAVNTTDYAKVAKATVGAVEITDKAQLAAADLNGDGTVDAFDASLLDLYINGEELY
ncbi:MAG: dockerin type I domain-containing protein [Ruminococcus sp.]|nr:dockerin type I domain-containing protein [Ruminococcus sp.]